MMIFLVTGIIRLCRGECYSGNITVSCFAELTEEQTQKMVRAIEEHLPHVRVAGNEEITCPVCLDEIGREDVAKLLPCKHYYHSECLLAWCTKRLQKEGAKSSEMIQCPICRCVHLLTDSVTADKVPPAEDPEASNFDLSGVNEPVPEELV
ncbi:unnamed protein product [Cladocopium goreaui]|uniref:RING-H2 finger protein ATL50 n=1 Tax=Cladocopium goreaui TaxID=2562237 RepID=A0A9P1M4S2_9DINO|nr:unnamed protein product [Cladocopium goreaui]